MFLSRLTAEMAVSFSVHVYKVVMKTRTNQFFNQRHRTSCGAYFRLNTSKTFDSIAIRTAGFVVMW